MTERLWVFSFLSLSSANRSSPFVWKNDQQRVRYSLHRRVDTHTNTKKRGNKISATTCVIVCIRELGCLDQTKQKMCLLWNVLWGPIRSHSKKKKKMLGSRKERRGSDPFPKVKSLGKKKKLKKFLHSSTASPPPFFFFFFPSSVSIEKYMFRRTPRKRVSFHSAQ